MSACPQCKSGELVERRNKKSGNLFYGCDRYPACKFAVASLGRLAPKPSATEAASHATSEPTSSTSNEGLTAALRELAAAVRSLAESPRKANPATEESR